MAGGFSVEYVAQLSQEGMAGEVGLSILEIEFVVEVRGIFSLIVLDDGFGFVQRLDEPGFRAGIVIVFLPECEKCFFLFGWQQGQDVFDVAFLGEMFSGFVRKGGG